MSRMLRLRSAAVLLTLAAAFVAAGVGAADTTRPLSAEDLAALPFVDRPPGQTRTLTVDLSPATRAQGTAALEAALPSLDGYIIRVEGLEVKDPAARRAADEALVALDGKEPTESNRSAGQRRSDG